MSIRLLRLLSSALQYIKVDIISGSWTGLNGLDRRLLAVIKPKLGGYYVELGANDGLSQSNTYKLQKAYGWNGLLIEPSPAKFSECVRNRSFGNRPFFSCCACVSEAYSLPFVEIEDSNLMSVCKGLEVSDQDASDHADLGSQFLGDRRLRIRYGALARTLTSVLADASAPFEFDLLSLDVEGNELAVLRGLDFSIYKPKWILVELRMQMPGVNGLEDFLIENGYFRYGVLSANERYNDVLYKSSPSVAST